MHILRSISLMTLFLFFEKSISIDNQNPYTFFTLGNITAMQYNQPQEALEYYKRAIYLDPDIDNAYLNLGNTYFLLGNYKNAIEQYKIELYYRATSTSALVNLGRVYQKTNNIIEAKKMFKDALKIDPSLTIAKNFLQQLK